MPECLAILRRRHLVRFCRIGVLFNVVLRSQQNIPQTMGKTTQPEHWDSHDALLTNSCGG